MSGGAPWEDEELALLRSNYPLVGAKVCARLMPRRSPHTIRQQAYRMGLARHGRPGADRTFQLIDRAISKAMIGAPDKRGRVRDRLTEDEIHEITDAVLRALPREVIVGMGDCDGKPIIAGFAEDGAEQLLARVCGVFQHDDPLFPTLERVPLIGLRGRYANG